MMAEFEYKILVRSDYGKDFSGVIRDCIRDKLEELNLEVLVIEEV